MRHVWQEKSHVGAPQLLLSYLWTSPHFHADFSLDVHLTLSRLTLLPPSSTLMAISVWIQPQELIRGAGPLSDQNSFNRKRGNVTFWNVRVVPTAALGLRAAAPQTDKLLHRLPCHTMMVIQIPMERRLFFHSPAPLDKHPTDAKASLHLLHSNLTLFLYFQSLLDQGDKVCGYIEANSRRRSGPLCTGKPLSVERVLAL